MMLPTIEILVHDTCDYCTKDMTKAGANPHLRIVRRSCDDHIANVTHQLALDKDEAWRIKQLLDMTDYQPSDGGKEQK